MFIQVVTEWGTIFEQQTFYYGYGVKREALPKVCPGSEGPALTFAVLKN